MAQINMPDAASLSRTSETADHVDQFFSKNPAVESRSIINGYSLIDGQYKSNVSTFFVNLKDFKERYASSKRARGESSSRRA